MATLALGALGAAAGSALLPAGLTVLGTTITGAAIGSQIGALAGHGVDQALFGSSGQSRAVDGPRLTDVRVTASTEGAPIPRLYGRARLGGQLIWACNLIETVVPRASTRSGSGKGNRGTANAGVDYTYAAHFAVALCEGPIASLGRVWADGREIDLGTFTWRLYTGTDAQQPDALIDAKQGAGNAPAYRGLAYVVFESMPLADFGNRIPQLSFEIFRPVDSLASQIRGISLIPGSGEFAYAPGEVSHTVNRISSAFENVHTRQGGTDWAIALDQLQSSLPNATSVSLVVSWFGTSLDAAQCQLLPCVERLDKETTPYAWRVSDVVRETAPIVSYLNGRPAFGGTPSDQSVVDAIRDLKARGLSVVFSPFILMDVPAGNALPDPYSSSVSQPVYPWRGRITVSPAAGRPGTPDKTSAATAAIAAFTGAAQASHFAIAGDTVTYSGPPEFSFRRMILHYAHLAKAAGGVDAFVLCSELRGLTWTRATANSYPFVTALQQLAADVRAILGAATKIIYAADWTEYFGHQPADGTGDVTFHLDPLWASPHIDAIGIDCYWPLADWRDGTTHTDALAGARSIYDQTYLRSNLTGGEGFTWYYASDVDRAAQVRTPITDGAGKPWVFRTKDLTTWWQSAHFNRPAGIESATPTAWVPQSKPIWFLELGCPAVDKGANQPNVFVDPKSSESFFPYFSTRTRDDAMQRAYLQAFHDAFDPASPDAVAGLNPVSSIYGSRMLDLSRMHVYCWDARPYPAFPNRTRTWGDGPNYALGHWISGRIASVSLGALLQRILDDYGFYASDAHAVSGMVPGFVIDRIMSARDAIQPLELAYFFDSLESEGRIVFRQRAGTTNGLTLSSADLVETRADAALAHITRAQETDLPAAAKVAYISSAGAYPQAIAEARRIGGASHRVSTATLPLVLDASSASAIADTWLFESWAAREKATFTLPPSQLALEPGDIVTLQSGDRSYLLRITEVGEHGARDIHALSIDPSVYGVVPISDRPDNPEPSTPAGKPLALFLDIPPLTDDTSDSAGYVAGAQSPWPGTLAVWRSPELSGFSLKALLPTPAITGVTVNALPTGPVWRLDHTNTLLVDIDSGTLESITRLQMLGGENLTAVERTPDHWELLQFESATLVGTGRYALTNLLRGQRGTEPAPGTIIPAGARFVLLDGSVIPVTMSADDIAQPFNWKVGPASRDIGDSSYLSVTHAFRGQGLLPWSPVQLRGTRNAIGDLTVTWLRRTRTNGDSWLPEEIPLVEDSESYRIDILASSAPNAATVRTITATSATTTYTAAQQTTDLGAPSPAITLRISQLSRILGPGTPATATL